MESHSMVRFETWDADDEFDGIFSKDELDTLLSIFRQLDTECTGKLRLEDLQQFIIMHGGTMDSEQVLDQWRSIDISGDGYVDTEEFLNWMAKAQIHQAQQAVDQNEASRSSDRMRSGPRFSMWSSQESLARRIKEEDDTPTPKALQRRESDSKLDAAVLNNDLLALDIENLREQLDNERQRRLDLEAELYDLAVTRDADMGGAVPIREYEKLRVAEQLAQEKLRQLTEQSAEDEQSRQRDSDEADGQQKDYQGRETTEKRRSTLRRTSWDRVRRTSGAGNETPVRRFAHSVGTIYPILSPRGGSDTRASNLSNVQFATGEEGGKNSSSEESDSESDKSQISMSFKKEVRKKSSLMEEKIADSTLDQESLTNKIQEVLSEVRECQKFQERAVDEVAVSLADKVLSLLSEEPVDVICAADVANRAAQIVQDHRKEVQEAAAELPLGAQVELADVRQTICSGLEDELADVQKQLKSCVDASGAAVTEQSEICSRLTNQAKQIRLAVETLPPPFVSPVPPSESLNAVAESMVEHLSEQLASIETETAEVASAVTSAVSSLRSTLALQHAVPVLLPAREDYFLDFYFDNLRLDWINDAAFMKEFRECLQNLGADAAELESLSLSQEGASLLASIRAPAATVHALEELPLKENVIVMGDVARVALGKSEAQRLNQNVSEELQGLRAQLEEIAVTQPMLTPAVDEIPDAALTPGFEGLWAAVVCQDDMVVGFASAGAKCRAEHWLLENGVRSLWELVLADGQESFLKALHLDPVRHDQARAWLESQTREVKKQRAFEALEAACSCRQRVKLEEALHIAEDANLQNDSHYELAQAALRQVWEEEVAQRNASLEAACRIVVPPGLPEVVSHIFLLSSPDGAEEEAQRLCDNPAFQSWVTWVPDDLNVAEVNPSMGFLRCRGRLRKEVETRLVRMPSALHFTFIFLSMSPLAQCTQEKLVDIASYIKLEVAQKSKRTLHIGVCGFSHIEECRRYLEEQACEQKRLHDVLSGVETLRSELKQSDIGREVHQMDELQQQLAAELQNACMMRMGAKRAMNSLWLKQLERERCRLESEKERSEMETKALMVETWELSHASSDLDAQDKLEDLGVEVESADETKEQISALRAQLEKIQNQQRGIEALQATNAKVSDYTRAEADAVSEHADELAATLRLCMETVVRPQGLDDQALLSTRTVQFVGDATERKRCDTLDLSNLELEELLRQVLHKARVRNVKLTPLPRASIQMHAKLSPSRCDPNALENIKMAVAEEVGRSHISLVDIAVSNVNDTVSCNLRIGGSTSVLAAVEALNAHRWRKEGLRELLADAGATDFEVAALWPLDRIQAEIQLSHGYRLDMSGLEAALLPMLVESNDLYSGAWEKACWEAPTALQALVQMESMVLFEDMASAACFKDQLLPMSEGRERGLAEVKVRQGAQQVGHLMCDAAAAHRQLKSRLLPNASWSEADLNDTRAIPPGHVLRTWHSSSLDAAPCGAHYDPGLEREDRVLSAADRMMQAFDIEPQVDAVFNISRLDIVFESAECLRNTVAWLLKNLDVVWLENRFRNPSCLGYRDLTVGVRWLVTDSDLTDPPQRMHINEIQLSLKELHDKKRDDGCRLCGEICSGLEKCGVQPKDLDDVWKLILQLLDCTDGRAAHDAQRHLEYVAERASSMASRSEGSIAVLAKELVEEAALQAMAAGVAAYEVKRAKAKLSGAVVRATPAELTGQAAQQVSREGAVSVDRTLAASEESGALPQYTEDHSATTRLLTNSVCEQQQSTSEMDLDDFALRYGHHPFFSGELLQLRTQIAGLKEHTERTEELRNVVLQMLQSSEESQTDSAGEQAKTEGHEIQDQDLVTAGRSDTWHRVDQAGAFNDSEHGALGERTTEMKQTSSRSLSPTRSVENSCLNSSVAEPQQEVQQLSEIGLKCRRQPQVDKWYRQRQGRWSRWLRDSPEPQGDSSPTPGVNEKECEETLAQEAHQEDQVDGDEGFCMWELLQRLQRQAPHWEADLRTRRAEMQLSASEPGDQPGQDTMELEHQQEESKQEEKALRESSPKGRCDRIKDLLHREERMRQEARLERVLQRLQERLFMQEQGQPLPEATRPAQASTPKVQVLLEPGTLPHQNLPQLPFSDGQEASPTPPPPALRDDRPRSQGSAPEISPRGLPSLRPPSRSAERADWETQACCSTRSNFLLDGNAAAIA